MKYYLESIIQKETETRQISEYEGLDEAERAYHKVLADNIDGNGVDFVRSKVINEHGGQEMCEYWQEEESETAYYFTQIRYKQDDSTLRAMASYATLDEASVAFHNLLYGVMADVQYKACMCLIEDKYGAELKRRYWERG